MLNGTAYLPDQGVYIYGMGPAEHVPSTHPFGGRFGLQLRF
jgi:hypothetical protein